MNSFLLAAFTGLTTGGISCLAVQGGLLASALTPPDLEKPLTSKERNLYVALFLLAKLIAYTILGFLLGSIGSVLSLSPQVQGWMQILAGLFMLATAARFLNLHPIFRYFALQPPKSAYKILKNQTKSGSFFAPLFLGTLTVLIPCGITQGMMVLAIASGSGLTGSLIMSGFILGTMPVFFALGVVALEMLKRKSLTCVATAVVAALGILSINTGQVLRGSAHTLQNYAAVIGLTGDTSGSQVLAKNNNGVQEASITVTDGGYEASTTTLKVGIPVKLKLISDNVRGCARSFTIPKLGISKILPQNGTETLEFTPDTTGRLAFTCSMGMYSGAFTVIN